MIVHVCHCGAILLIQVGGLLQVRIDDQQGKLSNVCEMLSGRVELLYIEPLFIGPLYVGALCIWPYI